ncbi:unnamed protein product [Oikopleura dioica]|uniref:Uncharacterized protein n=1 Tax=Oikopleura dioica TaxID=34765 RepID=E4WVQ9_OIKDI|nr:unnamed protein product [Oikopleura dioica]
MHRRPAKALLRLLTDSPLSGRLELVRKTCGGLVINVAISGEGLERVLTVQLRRRGSAEPREKIFEVLIDDPTIAKLQNLAICTTKGARAKLSISKDCCGNEPQGVSSFFTNSRRSEDCKFSCMSTNCRDECMPDTRCDRCLQHNCGTFSTESTF